MKILVKELICPFCSDTIKDFNDMNGFVNHLVMMHGYPDESDIKYVIKRLGTINFNIIS